MRRPATLTRRRQIRLPIELDDRLEDIAREHVESVSGLVRTAVTYWLYQQDNGRVAGRWIYPEAK